MSFAPVLRMAREWLGAPDARTSEHVAAVVARGRRASDHVPAERRDDWEKLLTALSKDDGEERMRARFEGLVRACGLFARAQRAAARARSATQEVRERPRIDAFDEVSRLRGFGPSARAALGEHGIRTVTDLLWLPPAAWDDLRAPSSVAAAVAQARTTYEATGGSLRPARVVVSAIVKSVSVIAMRGRRSVRVVLRDERDEKCTLHALWFFLAHGVLAIAKPDARVILVGRIKAEPKKSARMAHPEIAPDAPETRIVRARYARLGPPEVTLRKGILQALASGVGPDPVPASIARREAMPEVAPILLEIHGATCLPASDASKRAFVERLAWTEAFTHAWQRIALESKDASAPEVAPALPPRPDLVRALEDALGFDFTRGQRAAIAAIAQDLASPRPMRRLLLGDVGTGKTAVALAAAAQCIAAGRQVAILAPTSVLAEQYLDAIRPLEAATGARSAFVAAGMTASARRASHEALRAGEAGIAIGTHALLTEDVALPKLGLVVVDEQQRLGVAQRLALVRKGTRPHLLTLSATPIPRTLALALRGELATTTLRERPRGRVPVRTELVSAAQLETVVARVEDACARGERVFWIVPRVEPGVDDEDEEADDDKLASVVERREMLERALAAGKRRVVIVHGGLPADEKRRVMHAFRRGEADVLVGTTVVEVGVDVPEATLMVVEDAVQFGLAQLHQLRGRVGRGARPGSCLLVHADPLEGIARARLEALVELSSGDDIARRDLELRGAGDLGGTRQHGLEEDLVYLTHNTAYPWLQRIEEDARAIAREDPELRQEGHRVLGSLLVRFARAIAVREEAG